MVNPAALLTFKKNWDEFSARHPKFVSFLHTTRARGIVEGSVIDIKVTLPDGEVLQSNMKLTPEDIEFVTGLAGQVK